MTNQTVDETGELTLEQERLAQTRALISELLALAGQSAEKSRAAIMAAKKELGEYAAHAMASLYSDDGFQELVDTGQQVHQISDQIARQDAETARLAMLERLLMSPYFARIDFLFRGETVPEQMYIGRSNLKHPRSGEILVYDWRAPVASVFYRFGVGPAHYEAPLGRIDGELLLKRQFEIRAGRLEYFFDADVEILDEFLRQILSQNASAQMKTIVETIQKDQDAVIRDSENELLMVQGVAGSGKTSIGLHRVAYLMYQGLARRLMAENIVVLSPNTVFEQYISNVLPELGEQNVASLTVEKILDKALAPPPAASVLLKPPQPFFQTKNQLLESLLAGEDTEERRLARESLAFKTGRLFVEILERFIRSIPRRCLDFRDVDYAGRRIASRQDLKHKILGGKRGLPLGVLLAQLERQILERVYQLRPERLQRLRKIVASDKAHALEVPEMTRLLSIWESTALMRELRRFTKLDCLSLYRRLFEEESYFYELAKGLALPEDIGAILARTRDKLRACGSQLDAGLSRETATRESYPRFGRADGGGAGDRTGGQPCDKPADQTGVSQAAGPAGNQTGCPAAFPADPPAPLPHEDALALAYLTLRLTGAKAREQIRQVVVDEAQDYEPLHFELLRLLFPKARYTILGDVNQTIGKEEDLTLYEEIRRVLAKEKSALVTMDKSFRCTSEILRFSARFLDQSREIRSFSRPGQEPSVYAAAGREEQADCILHELAACRQEGLHSIGLICKTAAAAAKWHECLEKRGAAVTLIGKRSGEALTGAFVIPIYMAKGLEFDAVLVPDVDAGHYSGRDDRKLLYIACTRALHRLALFYTGEASPWLPEMEE